MSTLTGFVQRRPWGAFLAFAVFHVAVWTALPSLLYRNLPLDLIEALTYGREWQLGYDKLPPLPWWLVETAYRLVGADFAYYALAELSVIAAFWAVWMLARSLVGPTGALAALLITDGLHYFHYTAAKFNHDVIQLPFWALAGYAFRNSLRDGRNGWWLLVGVGIGLAFWSKYFVAVLLIPLALFVLLDDEARQALKAPGPWLAATVAGVVMAPHLVWLITHDFLPFAYANARATASRGPIDHLLHPAAFVATQAFFLAPSLMIAGAMWSKRPALILPQVDAFDRRILSVLAFGPAITVVAGSFLTGRGLIAMWGYPLWLFLGVWIVVSIGKVVERAPLERAILVWAVIFVGFGFAFVANYWILPQYDHRYRAVLFPGEQLATTLSQTFRARTDQPLTYVIASMWIGGNIAHYAPEHPRVLIDGDPRRAPWIDLADLRIKGAVVVWIEGDQTTRPATLQDWITGAQMQASFSLSSASGANAVGVRWAILPPQH